ncbi:MAG: DUF2065 domain-containing protein [Azoarcus sp.]|uniref:DUF2065 domain-containing protein n=1 Tax=Pseudazoarcus pumilus TaxID=2067960 RepID=A0A2I6S4A7_9RHOO|nr:DUF2065 domain-containing protein [Pseudazoarcus pumilus]AUN94094.1 DUF2065 domain-containing protein [Pseudazoarcus pumilus]MBA4742387.1 DUF2065 domain-containing protein [Azoarcus sp.]
MGTSLVMAFALMLIFEGLLPFVAPARWREAFLRLARLADGQIRFVGLGSMLIGVLILLLV